MQKPQPLKRGFGKLLWLDSLRLGNYRKTLQACGRKRLARNKHQDRLSGFITMIFPRKVIPSCVGCPLSMYGSNSQP